MHARLTLLLAIAGCDVPVAAAPAGFDPTALWQRWWPMSRSARLVDLSRVALAPGEVLEGVIPTGAHRGAVVDDGHDARVAWAGRVHSLARGGGPITELAWIREGTIRGVTGSGTVATLVPSPAPSDGTRAAVVGGWIYYTSDDSLVRTTGGAAAKLAPLGRGFAGAFDSDGRDVFVGDREAVWKWDIAAGKRVRLPLSVYWPGELAVHGGRLLVDAHGHGAVVLERDGHVTTLDTHHLEDTDELAWIGDTAVVAGKPLRIRNAAALAELEAGRSTSGDDVDDTQLDQALFCWHSELEPAEGGR